MSRQDSRARAERAHRLRAIGRSWQEVADTEGFRSRRSAQRAVARLLAAELPEGVESSRRTAAESLRITTAVLFERFAAAADRNDDAAAALLNRELVRNRDQLARLLGLYAPERAEVSHDVSGLQGAAFVEAIRTRALALVEANTATAAAPALPSIDAEVIE